MRGSSGYIGGYLGGVESSRFGADWKLLRRTWLNAPLPTRVHVLGRFLTCPLSRLLDFLPPAATLLDLGAGHGILAWLALARGASRAVALEPDGRKVLASRRVLAGSRVQLVVGYAEAVAGTFDAVAIADVLYRVEPEGWDPLLVAARERLAPGGLLLLKEIDPERRAKALWNRLQERIADAFGLTLGTAFRYEPRARMAQRLGRLGFEGIEVLDLGAGYPHAHILYLARRGTR